MAQGKVEDIRNIVFCGHGSAGKTTLVDNILVTTGAVKRPASVDDGTSICDFDEEEKHHKHSIESTLVHFEHGGKHFNLIDTPGYPDFIGQVIGALHAVDTAAIVINAHAGIDVNTRRVFQEAGKRGLGRMIVITQDGHRQHRLSRPAAHDSGTVRQGLHPAQRAAGPRRTISRAWPARSIRRPRPTARWSIRPRLHESLIETIIEVDDEVTERYFEGTLPTEDELSRLIVEAVAAGSLIPIVCVSAKTGVGMTELLDALAQCALPPDKIARIGNERGRPGSADQGRSGRRRWSPRSSRRASIRSCTS